MKRINFLMMSIVLAIFMTTIASAVTLDSGTVLNTTISNSSMTFVGCSWEVEQVDIYVNAITITNASDLTIGETVYNFPYTINHTAENTNYNCAEIGEAFKDSSFPQNTNEICTGVLGDIAGFGPYLGIFLAIFGVFIIVGLVAIGVLAIQNGAVDAGTFDMKVVVGFMIAFFGFVILLVVTMITIAGICGAG